MLPYQAHDPQRVERKRHLGNDVVLIIFNESNSPFDPCEIHSHFNRNTSSIIVISCFFLIPSFFQIFSLWFNLQKILPVKLFISN